MIQDYTKKIKSFWEDNKQDLFIAAVIFLVGLASFGLGRLSILWPKKEPLVIEEFGQKAAPLIKSTASKESSAVILSKGKYVASKNGTAYHFPWCPGALRIKEENKIWFQTKEEAESRGYKPAGNCEGL
jgi:hypothetical protein